MHCCSTSPDIFIAYCRLCDDRRSAFTVSQVWQPDYKLPRVLFMLETYGTSFKIIILVFNSIVIWNIRLIYLGGQIILMLENFPDVFF